MYHNPQPAARTPAIMANWCIGSQVPMAREIVQAYTVDDGDIHGSNIYLNLNMWCYGVMLNLHLRIFLGCFWQCLCMGHNPVPLLNTSEILHPGCHERSNQSLGLVAITHTHVRSWMHLQLSVMLQTGTPTSSSRISHFPGREDRAINWRCYWWHIYVVGLSIH